MTTATRAINGWGTGVTKLTIQNLIVQHFADQGIQCRDTWVITHDEIRYNHGDGLEDCPTVTYSNLHDNGRTVTYTGQIGSTQGPAHTTVTNNIVTGNNGSGLSFDWGNQFITVSGNDIERNVGPGIDYEASYDAVISNNTWLERPSWIQ